MCVAHHITTRGGRLARRSLGRRMKTHWGRWWNKLSHKHTWGLPVPPLENKKKNPPPLYTHPSGRGWTHDLASAWWRCCQLFFFFLDNAKIYTYIRYIMFKKRTFCVFDVKSTTMRRTQTTTSKFVIYPLASSWLTTFAKSRKWKHTSPLIDYLPP